MTFEDWYEQSALYPFDGQKDAARMAWNAAVKAERERCAVVCEVIGEDGSLMFQQAAEAFAKAIREQE